MVGLSRPGAGDQYGKDVESRVPDPEAAVLLDMINLWRQAGLPVSTAEVVDFLRALEVAPAREPEDLFFILAATLAKDEVTSRLVEKFWRLSGWPPVSGGLSVSRAEVMDGRGLGWGGAGGSAGELLAVIGRGQDAEIDALVRRAVAGMGPLSLAEAADLEDACRRVQVSLDWFMAVYELEKACRRGEISRREYEQWQERLAHTKEKIRETLEAEVKRRLGPAGLRAILENSYLARKDFLRLSATEVKSMYRQIALLGHHLATRPGRRLRPGPRGYVDLRRTVQQAGRTAGIPARLAHRTRQPSRPELVLLCDVSNSVAQFSLFMLALIYHLSRHFSQVRTFVFVDTLVEVTTYLRHHTWEESIRAVQQSSTSSRFGFSDFGRVFTEFACHYLPLIGPRTTLIVLGDARNNWRDPGTVAWEKMTRQAGRTYWLNPYPHPEWGSGDSLMHLYAPYCTGVYECRNLQQLSRLARSIF